MTLDHFNGYGKSLIDYNSPTQDIGLDASPQGFFYR
ncbi:MAG: phospholipase A [Shewanella sp.]|nr:phospholipase A [Shewanella sp.]